MATPPVFKNLSKTHDAHSAYCSLAKAELRRHGYEISKLIEARSGGTLRFHVASLYPLLYRLEGRGWIQGRWAEKAGQRRRRYYRLTPQGRKIVREFTVVEPVQAFGRPDGAEVRGRKIGARLLESGARLVGTLVREMDHRGVEYGLATMCIGVGQGIASIWQRL